MMKFLSLLILISSIFSFSPVQAETTVLTYNTWGVPFAVKDTWRYAAAMKAIEKLNPDIVILDEVFSRKGKHQFQSSQYPYVAKGPNPFFRLVGSGSRILSKYPFEFSNKEAYHNCAKSDCLSRKGMVFVIVDLPSGKKFNLTATHLNSAGDDQVRIEQLEQLKDFTEANQDDSIPNLVVGDFNFGPASQAYQYARSQIELNDTWIDTHPDKDPGLSYDFDHNQYAHDYCIATKDNHIVDRIDFMFYKGAIKPTESHLIFNQPGEIYSDHYGVIADFEI